MKTIVISVITCKRPEGLERLLHSLSTQTLDEDMAAVYSCKIHVIDNDLGGENPKVVDHIKQTSPFLDITLFEEAEPGIPAARNASVRHAQQVGADAMIFVDDDEEACEGWLNGHLKLWRETDADIITGPVDAVIPDDAPHWAKPSRAFDKQKNIGRGEQVPIAYTNNTLVSKKLLDTLGPIFDQTFRYTGSSDLHFFLCAIRKGFTVLWCPDARMREYVPLSRISYKWILKRGFRSGSGETIAYKLIDGRVKAFPVVLFRSAARIALGLGQVIAFPLTRWNGVICGSRRIASAIGGLSGLFGVTHDEYRTIHK